MDGSRRESRVQLPIVPKREPLSETVINSPEEVKSEAEEKPEETEHGAEITEGPKSTSAPASVASETDKKPRSRYGDLRLARVLYLDSDGDTIHDLVSKPPREGAQPYLQILPKDDFRKMGDVIAYRDKGLALAQAVADGKEVDLEEYKEEYPIPFGVESTLAIIRLVSVSQTKEVREVQTVDVTESMF